MSHSSEKKLVLVAAWGFVLTGIALVTQQTLQADDSKCPDGRQCQVRVEVRGKLPFLDKIPLVKYFTHSTQDSSACTAAGDDCERLGVDFDLMPGHMVAFLPNGDRQVICVENECPACVQQKACAESKVAAQRCKACADGECGACADEALAQCKVKTAQAVWQFQPACVGEHHHQVCEQVAAVRAENAALSAAHEANESIMDAQSELFEAVLGLSIEKAKLEAKLELVSEREKMHEKLLELQAENTKLKAEAEFVAAQAKLMAGSMVVALENEKLKLRVAELERSPFSPSPKRTAKKSSQVK